MARTARGGWREAAQHPAAVHGGGGDHVEDHERHVDVAQGDEGLSQGSPPRERMSIGTERLPPKSRASPKKRGGSQHHVDERPCHGDLDLVDGLSGNDFILASPPMGKSVMSRTSLPSRRATSEWPNSCSKTQKNKRTTRPTVTSALPGFPNL